jgi:hypothetical protein
MTLREKTSFQHPIGGVWLCSFDIVKKGFVWAVLPNSITSMLGQSAAEPVRLTAHRQTNLAQYWSFSMFCLPAHEFQSGWISG